MEGLLHCFGYRIEAKELELHQQSEETQARLSDQERELHELKQYMIPNPASYLSRLTILEGQMQQVKGQVRQSSEQIEDLKGQMAQLELDQKNAGLENRMDMEVGKIEGMEMALHNRMDQQN